jgi:hypothetical protein
LIGVLLNTDNPNVEINTRELQAAARAIGQQNDLLPGVLVTEFSPNVFVA